MSWKNTAKYLQRDSKHWTITFDGNFAEKGPDSNLPRYPTLVMVKHALEVRYGFLGSGSGAEAGAGKYSKVSL